MESRPRESWPAARAKGRLQALHASALDLRSPQRYIAYICSLSDQPSGLRQGFVFWGQANRGPAGGWVHAA